MDSQDTIDWRLTNSDDDFDRWRRCVLCHNVLKLPKTLPCLHTACTHCLCLYEIRERKRFKKRHTRDHLDKYMMPCPACHYPCHLPSGPNEMVTNKWFLQLVYRERVAWWKEFANNRESWPTFFALLKTTQTLNLMRKKKKDRCAKAKAKKLKAKSEEKSEAKVDNAVKKQDTSDNPSSQGTSSQEAALELKEAPLEDEGAAAEAQGSPSNARSPEKELRGILKKSSNVNGSSSSPRHVQIVSVDVHRSSEQGYEDISERSPEIHGCKEVQGDAAEALSLSPDAEGATSEFQGAPDDEITTEDAQGTTMGAQDATMADQMITINAQGVTVDTQAAVDDVGATDDQGATVEAQEENADPMVTVVHVAQGAKADQMTATEKEGALVEAPVAKVGHNGLASDDHDATVDVQRSTLQDNLSIVGDDQGDGATLEAQGASVVVEVSWFPVEAQGAGADSQGAVDEDLKANADDQEADRHAQGMTLEEQRAALEAQMLEGIPDTFGSAIAEWLQDEIRLEAELVAYYTQKRENSPEKKVELKKVPPQKTKPKYKLKANSKGRKLFNYKSKIVADEIHWEWEMRLQVSIRKAVRGILISHLKHLDEQFLEPLEEDVEPAPGSGSLQHVFSFDLSHGGDVSQCLRAHAIAVNSVTGKVMVVDSSIGKGIFFEGNGKFYGRKMFKNPVTGCCFVPMMREYPLERFCAIGRMKGDYSTPILMFVGPVNDEPDIFHIIKQERFGNITGFHCVDGVNFISIGNANKSIWKYSDFTYKEISTAEMLKYPTHITNGVNKEIVISDTGNHRIAVFSGCNYDDVRFVGKYGHNDGELFWPLGVAVDKKGRLFVCDTNNYRVQVFNANYEFESIPIKNTFRMAASVSQDVKPIDCAIDAQQRVLILFRGRGFCSLQCFHYNHPTWCYYPPDEAPKSGFGLGCLCCCTKDARSRSEYERL